MDTETVIRLINLFFVPMLPVYLYYKSSKQPLAPSLELLFRYAVTAALLIPLAKVIAFLPGRLTANGTIPLDSGYYTLAALIAAWLLPDLFRLAGSVSGKVKRLRLRKKTEASGGGDSPDGAAE